MRRSVFSLLMFSLPAFPGWLSVGVKGGVPVTNAFHTASSQDLRYLSDTKRYTLGPVVELRFPLGLGGEFNALYKRVNYESSQALGPVPIQAATTGNSWEFPLLFKLRGPGVVVHPYVSAGPSFRHLSDLRQTVLPFLASGAADTSRPAELENRFSTGFVIGGGLELGHRFRIAPEIRYTRWAWENFRQPAISGFRTNLNQVDFLLGIHF